MLLCSHEKAAVYENTAKEITAVLEGEPNLIARMATVSCLLAQAFESFFWTGFYVVDPSKDKELVVGPYQGSLGCMRIAYDRGVCGAAATTKQTQIVDDVHAFPGHIPCDAASNSEIVVPVLNGVGELIAVFDVDSTEFAAFDATDKEWLERIITETFAK